MNTEANKSATKTYPIACVFINLLPVEFDIKERI